MSFTAQLPAPAGWPRWPQHHPNDDSFFPAPAYTQAPFPSTGAPQYVHGLPSVTYGEYASLTTSPVLGSPFKHDQYHEWPQLRVNPPISEGGRGIRDPRKSLNPSTKSESRAVSVAPRHSTNPATGSSSLPAAGVVSNTRVDALVKAIQSKSEVDPAQKKADVVSLTL